MIDVGLQVGPRDKLGLRKVSAMLPDESEWYAHVNTTSGLGINEFIEQVAKGYQKPEKEFADLKERIIQRGEIADCVANGKQIDKFTLGSLVEKYPKLQPPVVEGLLREGEVGNIVSVPKVGKSWGVYGLGVSIVMGWDWLGRFPVSQGRVLLIDNELHPSTLAQRIPKVATAMGESRNAFFSHDQLFDGFDVWSLRGNLRTLEELGSEFDSIEPGYYKLVIFDAKYRFALAGVSENDNAAETIVANTLDKYAAKMNAALLMVHHASKGTQSDKRVTDIGAGAGAQSRAADCHIVLREHEDEGLMVLDAAVRSFPPVESLALRWDYPLWIPDDTADVRALKGKKTKGEERQTERDNEAKRTIAKILIDGPATARQIRTKTGFGPDRVNRLMNLLASDGVTTSQEVEIKGNKCLEYQLAESALQDVVG